MIDENSPEMLKLLSPYQDNIAALRRKATNAAAEFAETQAKRDKEFEETAKRRQAELAVIEAERAEQRKKAEEARKAEEAKAGRRPDGWTRPRDASTEMRFGPQGEDEHGWPTPSQAAAAPPPPPQWVAPAAQQAQPPRAPQPRPRPRHAAAGNDDDDMSGETWMR
jgi:hypothetical protein